MSYDIRDLVKARAATPLEVDVEGLGIVKFIPLSVKEIEEIDATIPDTKERGLYLLWLMLSKVEPELMLAEMKEWRLDILDAIADAVMARVDFRAKKST